MKGRAGNLGRQVSQVETREGIQHLTFHDVLDIERDPCTAQRIVEAQSPVFPSTEDQPAAELFVKVADGHRVVAVRPRDILLSQVIDRETFHHIFITLHRSPDQRMGIILELHAGRKTPQLVVELQEVVRTVTVVRNDRTGLAVLHIVDRIGFKTAAQMTQIPLAFGLVGFFIRFRVLLIRLRFNSCGNRFFLCCVHRRSCSIPLFAPPQQGYGEQDRDS